MKGNCCIIYIIWRFGKLWWNFTATFSEGFKTMVAICILLYCFIYRWHGTRYTTPPFFVFSFPAHCVKFWIILFGNCLLLELDANLFVIPIDREWNCNFCCSNVECQLLQCGNTKCSNSSQLRKGDQLTSTVYYATSFKKDYIGITTCEWSLKRPIGL